MQNLSHSVPRIAVGRRRDSARVQDNQIGVSGRSYGFDTFALKCRLERRAICLGRATAEALHKNAFITGIRHQSSVSQAWNASVNRQ
jgi:hypothetical protein